MLFKYPYQVYNEIMNLNENFLFLITNYDNGMCNTIIRMSDEVYYLYNEPIDKSEIKDYFFKGRFIRIYRFSSVMQFNLYNQIVHETDIQAINKFKVYSNEPGRIVIRHLTKWRYKRLKMRGDSLKRDLMAWIYHPSRISFNLD